MSMELYTLLIYTNCAMQSGLDFLAIFRFSIVTQGTDQAFISNAVLRTCPRADCMAGMANSPAAPLLLTALSTFQAALVTDAPWRRAAFGGQAPFKMSKSGTH